MKKVLLSCIFLFSFLVQRVEAQQTEIFKEKGYELIITTKDASFSEAHKKMMVDLFFLVYPKMVQTYNLKAAKKVNFVIDPVYDGIAATTDATVRFSQNYLSSYLQDIDVVTHELMHIVQDYRESVGPGWLTEGIADYVRDQFGLNNAGAKWSLGAYQSSQNYDNGYNTTARFLKWIEQTRKPGFVKEINQRLYQHTYKSSDWEVLTGKTVKELWKAYILSPNL